MPVVRETDPVSGAARAAIARAKARGGAEVTPDDLLVGALAELARFGITLVGPWAIDIAELEGAAPAEPPAAAEDTASAAPSYSEASVAVFEEASRLASRDGSATLGLVHLLAALGEREEGLMARLRDRHGFTSLEWRAALARGEFGTAANGRGPDAHADGDGSGGSRVPELFSVDRAASFLDVHAQTVRNYIRAGKLPAYRLAGERFIRVLRRDLMRLLEPVDADDTGEPDTELPISTSHTED